MIVFPYTAGYFIVGASGEAKPAVANGSIFIEGDTGKVFFRAGAAWVEKSGGAVLASGVYNPTLTNVANLDGSTSYEAQYMQVGSVVTVSGKVDVNPTVPAAVTQLGISLPIASNIGAVEDCCGVAFASGIAGQGAAILGDLTNNRAQMEWISGDVTNQPMSYSFTYQII